MKKKMTVIGGGLIGGSIAAALRTKATEWELTCLDFETALDGIRHAGFFHRVLPITDCATALEDQDMVVLAASIEGIMSLLVDIGPHLKEGAIVTDVGSTKVQIEKQAKEKLPARVFFVGGHPITGSERRGIGAADPFLFKHKPYVLCPEPDGDEKSFLKVLNFVEELGAIPISIEPAEHDGVFAMVSHAPQLVAVALMHAARKLDTTHGILDLVAGSGFLDMTRIAASSLDVWRGILNTNTDAVSAALDGFTLSLAELREAVESGNPAPVWEPARQRRREMQPKQPSRDSHRDLRNQVDALDAELLRIIHRRLETVKKIGDVKRKNDLPIFDPERENRVKEHWAEYGSFFGFSDAFVSDLFGVISSYAKKLQA